MSFFCSLGSRTSSDKSEGHSYPEVELLPSISSAISKQTNSSSSHVENQSNHPTSPSAISSVAVQKITSSQAIASSSSILSKNVNTHVATHQQKKNLPNSEHSSMQQLNNKCIKKRISSRKKPINKDRIDLIKAILANPEKPYTEIAKLGSVTCSAARAKGLIRRMCNECKDSTFIDKHKGSEQLTMQELKEFVKIRASREKIHTPQGEPSLNSFKLIKAVLDNPKKTYPELAALDSVHYTAGTIGVLISKMRNEFPNDVFIKKYKQSGRLTEEQLKKFIEILSPHNTSHKKYGPRKKPSNDALKVIQAILDNPQKSAAEIADLGSISYTSASTSSVISKLRRECREGTFLDKYKESGQFTEEQLKTCKQTLTSHKKYKPRRKYSNDTHKVIQAIIENPHKSPAEVAVLDSIPYAPASAGAVISKLRRECLDETFFLDKYMKSGHLTKEQLKTCIQILTSQKKPSSPKPCLTERPLKLIKAMLDNPGMSYEELAKLATVPYTANNISTVISKMRRDRRKGTFIDKYMKSNQFTEEQLERFINEALPSRKQLQKGYRIKLIQVMLENPTATSEQLANLLDPPSSSSRVRDLIYTIRKEYQNGTFFDKYMKSGHFKKQQLEKFIEILDTRTKYSKNNPLKLIKAMLDNPYLSHNDLASLDTVPYPVNTICSTLDRMRKAYQNGTFFKNYATSGQFTREQLEQFMKNISPQNKLPQLKKPRKTNPLKLIKAILDNPDMSYEELASLDTISYSVTTIKSTLSRMRTEYNKGTFFNKYMKSGHFKKQQLEKFIENILPQKQLPQKQPAISDHLGLVQIVLDNELIKLVLDHQGNKSYTNLAKLNLVSYSADEIKTAFHRMLEEHRNNIFFDKYTRATHFKREELKQFIETIASYE